MIRRQKYRHHEAEDRQRGGRAHPRLMGDHSHFMQLLSRSSWPRTTQNCNTDAVIAP